MKLVFRKYMEFENNLGNQNKLSELRNRVEQYLETAFKNDESQGSDSDQADDAKQEKPDEDMQADDSSSGEANEDDSDEEASGDEEGEEEMESSSDN